MTSVPCVVGLCPFLSRGRFPFSFQGSRTDVIVWSGGPPEVSGEYGMWYDGMSIQDCPTVPHPGPRSWIPVDSSSRDLHNDSKSEIRNYTP